MTAKRRSRIADRLQDGIVVALVLSALGFSATASRADRDGAGDEITVVQAPLSACANVAANHRSSCLSAAAAVTLRR